MGKLVVRSELEKLLNSLKNAVTIYDNMHFSDRNFVMFLANGDKINYNVNENSIAHLLGVDTSYLLSTNINM